MLAQGFRVLWGDLEAKIDTRGNGAVYALSMTKRYFYCTEI